MIHSSECLLDAYNLISTLGTSSFPNCRLPSVDSIGPPDESSIRHNTSLHYASRTTRSFFTNLLLYWEAPPHNWCSRMETKCSKRCIRITWTRKTNGRWNKSSPSSLLWQSLEDFFSLFWGTKGKSRWIDLFRSLDSAQSFCSSFLTSPHHTAGDLRRLPPCIMLRHLNEDVLLEAKREGRKIKKLSSSRIHGLCRQTRSV